MSIHGKGITQTQVIFVLVTRDINISILSRNIKSFFAVCKVSKVFILSLWGHNCFSPGHCMLMDKISILSVNNRSIFSSPLQLRMDIQICTALIVTESESISILCHLCPNNQHCLRKNGKYTLVPILLQHVVVLLCTSLNAH